MRKISWLMLICISICFSFGCGNATQSNGMATAPASTELPDDVKVKLADYELAKYKLNMLEQDYSMFKDLYMNSVGVSTNNNTGSNVDDLATIKDLREQLRLKVDELSKTTDELLQNKNEVKSLNDKVTDANVEIENLKTALEEAKKASPTVTTDTTSNIEIEGAILLKMAEYAASKTRGVEVTAMINEFLKANPSENSKFTNSLTKLAGLEDIAATYDDDAVNNFTAIAGATNNSLTKCSASDDLPGIVYGLIANQVKNAKSADVALVIDTTATMDEEINKLKRAIGTIYTQLTEICKDIRISIVTYRDLKTKFGDPGYVTQIETDFTRVIRDIVMGVRKMSIETSGNFDVPEAVFEGIMTGLKDLSWSSRADKRVMLLIGDAPAGIGDKIIEHPRRGKIDLEAKHEFTIDSMKTQLDAMKADMMTDETPVSILPIACAK